MLTPNQVHFLLREVIFTFDFAAFMLICNLLQHPSTKNKQLVDLLLAFASKFGDEAVQILKKRIRNSLRSNSIDLHSCPPITELICKLGIDYDLDHRLIKKDSYSEGFSLLKPPTDLSVLQQRIIDSIRNDLVECMIELLVFVDVCQSGTATQETKSSISDILERISFLDDKYYAASGRSDEKELEYLQNGIMKILYDFDDSRRVFNCPRCLKTEIGPNRTPRAGDLQLSCCGGCRFTVYYSPLFEVQLSPGTTNITYWFQEEKTVSNLFSDEMTNKEKLKIAIETTLEDELACYLATKYAPHLFDI
jgi:hypothetical protein